MKLKNLLLMGIASIIVFLPTVAFAEETDTEEKDWRTFRLEQVAEYTPDQLSEWERLFESKDTLMTEREMLRSDLEILIETVWKPYIEEQKEDIRESLQAYAETLKLQVEAGEITAEEADVLFAAFKDTLRVDIEAMKAEKEIEKAEREADKLYADGLREERKALNESIKAAIEAEDFEVISGYLNAILAINQELEDYGIEVNELIEDKIDEINAL